MKISEEDEIARLFINKSVNLSIMVIIGDIENFLTGISFNLLVN